MAEGLPRSEKTAVPSVPEAIGTYPWAHKEHHGRGSFQNIWGPYNEPTGWQAAGWIMGRSWKKEKSQKTAFQKVDPAVLTSRSEPYRVFWLGHATALIQSGGLNILTDPIFEERASPLRSFGPERQTGVPLSPADLPAIDVVVISHNHYDHLSEKAIRLLAGRPGTLFLVPLGLAALLKSWGASRVLELDWWQYVDIKEHRFSATPVQHFSSRSLTDRNETLWTGWYIHARRSDRRFYFAGDTGYGPFFRETRERLGRVDLALIPIGAYRPRWFMQIVHVDPPEALRAAHDLEARHVLPIHWGTYDLADEPLHEPIELLRQTANDYKGKIIDIPVGGSFKP